MSNYSLSIKDKECLREIGVPDHEMNGYGVMDAETFILREYYSNRREQGHDVPEDYQPQPASRKERELKYREKLMYDLEGERVNKEPEGFPDPYKWYEEEEIVYDDSDEEWMPDWIHEKKEKERTLERLQTERMKRVEDHLKEKYERKMRNMMLKQRYLERKEVKA